MMIAGRLPTAAQEVHPDNPAPAPIVQEFSGNGTTTTGLFTVQDNWEVRWNARQVVSVAVMSKDGTIVAGAAGVLRGSLFVPLRGDYYLKISDGTVSVPASPAASSSVPASPPGAAIPPSTNGPPPAANPAPAPATNAAASGPNASPVGAVTNAVSTPAAPSPGDSAAPDPSLSWHLQVIQLGGAVSAGQSLTVYAPFFVPPDSAITPAPPEPPPPVLTSQEAACVVKVKGDRQEGAGFLVRLPAGTFVLTHLRLLEANPNITVTTLDGAEIPTLGLKGAADRDLAIFQIKDNNYTYLAPSDDPRIDSGEPLIIPDLGGPTAPLLGKAGRIIGMTAERVDFDNPLGRHCAGAPVILAKNGTALAIVTGVRGADVTDRIAQAWPANPAPGSADIIPYYGLRLTADVPWETYDPQLFLDQTLFLRTFHQRTRCLDSFLNGLNYQGGRDEEYGPPSRKYFERDAKLREAFNSYRHFAADADNPQRTEAASELLSDLQGLAATDVATLQATAALYSFTKTRIAEELAYRQALLAELDRLSNDSRKLDDIISSH